MQMDGNARMSLSLSLNLTLNLPKKKSEREEENYVGRKSLLGDMVSS